MHFHWHQWSHIGKSFHDHRWIQIFVNHRPSTRKIFQLSSYSIQRYSKETRRDEKILPSRMVSWLQIFGLLKILWWFVLSRLHTFPDGCTPFFCFVYWEKTFFQSKMLTLRIEKKNLLPTGRLYFLCCLARRPINWTGFALRVYNSSYTWRCSSAARRFKVHFFCFILWSRTTFYDSKGFLIHFLLFRLKFRVAIFGTSEVTLAYHYPRLTILANQKRMVNFVKNIPSALVYRTI